MTNPDSEKQTLKPDLHNPRYRKFLERALQETPGLNLLSLVDIKSGQMYVPPEQTVVEQAQLACCLFAGLEQDDLEQLTEVLKSDMTLYQVGAHQLVALPQDEGSELMTVIAFPDHFALPKFQPLIAQATASLAGETLQAALGSSSQIVRGWQIDIAGAVLVDSYQRSGSQGSQALKVVDALDPIGDILPLMQSLQTSGQASERGWLDGVTAFLDGRILRWLRIPFISDHVLFADSSSSADDVLVLAEIERTKNDILRQVVGEVLATGLETHVLPFPKTDVEFAEIVRDLRALDKNDLRGRLVEGGFADHPQVIEGINMRCRECIYFLPNRLWCDLPELPISVEPDWYCRLWKM